jgi:hypothetical protein
VLIQGILKLVKRLDQLSRTFSVIDGYRHGPQLIDTDGDGVPDALGYDTTGDGRVDALDTNMDGSIDAQASAVLRDDDGDGMYDQLEDASVSFQLLRPQSVPIYAPLDALPTPPPPHLPVIYIYRMSSSICHGRCCVKFFKSDLARRCM